MTRKHKFQTGNVKFYICDIGNVFILLNCVTSHGNTKLDIGFYFDFDIAFLKIWIDKKLALHVTSIKDPYRTTM